jgi:MoxR-like ATPase
LFAALVEAAKGLSNDERNLENRMAETKEVEAQVRQFKDDVDRLKKEIGKVIVGQHEVVEGVITCMLASGHVLLEGVPGLGKTKLVSTLSKALDLNFHRIQFTPDLMPADIVGTNIIVEDANGAKRFEFQRGPIFANIVLADEINRATPKTQSALLEAMQEHSVTVSKTTYKLDQPFFVLATQNPLEMEGTYPLPEAQLDRFFFKLQVRFPGREELHSIMDRTTGGKDEEVKPALNAQKIAEMRSLAREVPVAKHVQDFGIRVLQATHPDFEKAPAVTKKYVRFGSSPRGAQAVQMGAKIHALLDGRYHASVADMKAVMKAALRHRLILNFEGEAEGISTDSILDKIIDATPEKL